MGDGQEQNQEDQSGCFCKRRDGADLVEKLRSKALDNESQHSNSGVVKASGGVSLSLKHPFPWSLKDGEAATLLTFLIPLLVWAELRSTHIPFSHIFQLDPGMIVFLKNLHLRICLLVLEREEGRNREKHQRERETSIHCPPVCPPTHPNQG